MRRLGAGVSAGSFGFSSIITEEKKSESVGGPVSSSTLVVNTLTINKDHFLNYVERNLHPARKKMNSAKQRSVLDNVLITAEINEVCHYLHCK